MIRSPVKTRKRAQMESSQESITQRETEMTIQRTASEESPSIATVLQAVLQEVQQLREEQRRARAEFTETLRQRDAEVTQQQLRQEEFAATLRQRDTEIAQLQEKLRGIPTNQISPSNNVFHSSPPLRVDDRSVVCANNSLPVNSVASAGNIPDSVVSVNRANLVASVTNFSNSGESVAGFDDSATRAINFNSGINTVNRREMPVNSVGSAERFDPTAPFRGGACVKLKPDTYDGSAPLREFFAQFNLIARANRWEEETKTAVLVSCLRGKARAVLESMQNLESFQFEELKSKLELRFGETHSLQNYYSQFINRKQRFGENIASLGSDIERLSQLAYPECPDTVRDKIACAQFVSALSDGFVKRSLQMEGKTSLREAIERGKAIKLIQENNFQYKKESNLNFERKRESQIEKNNGESEGNKFNGKKFKKLPVNKNFEGRKNNKECWECGKEGHFRSECPGKAGNKE